jgi:hypothetical protein
LLPFALSSFPSLYRNRYYKARLTAKLIDKTEQAFYTFVANRTATVSSTLAVGASGCNVKT